MLFAVTFMCYCVFSRYNFTAICKVKVLRLFFSKLINISPKIINILIFFLRSFCCSNLVQIPWMCDNNNCIDNHNFIVFFWMSLLFGPTSISIGMWTHCIMSLEIFPVNSIFLLTGGWRLHWDRQVKKTMFFFTHQ